MYQLVADIELGSHGAKWRHNWVPLNPTAVAMKLKKFGKGDKGRAPGKTRFRVTSLPSGPGRTKSAHRLAQESKAKRALPSSSRPRISTPSGVDHSKTPYADLYTLAQHDPAARAEKLRRDEAVYNPKVTEAQQALAAVKADRARMAAAASSPGAQQTAASYAGYRERNGMGGIGGTANASNFAKLGANLADALKEGDKVRAERAKIKLSGEGRKIGESKMKEELIHKVGDRVHGGAGGPGVVTSAGHGKFGTPRYEIQHDSGGSSIFIGTPKKAGPAVDRKAQLQIKPTTYQGESGFSVTGTDVKGRKVKVFAKDRGQAYLAVNNIREGKPAFAERASVKADKPSGEGRKTGVEKVSESPITATTQHATNPAIKAAVTRAANKRAASVEGAQNKAMAKLVNADGSTRVHEVNGLRMSARASGQGGSAPGQVNIEHAGGGAWHGVMLGHITATPEGKFAVEDYRGKMARHEVNTHTQALAALGAAHTLHVQERDAAKAAQDAKLEANRVEWAAKREAERAAQDAARKAEDRRIHLRDIAAAESNRRRMAEIPKGIRPTVTKNDSPTKLKLRETLGTSLTRSAVDVHSVDAKTLTPGQAVTFKVDKFEATPQPPHSKVTNLNYNAREFTLNGQTFVTDHNGVVQAKASSAWGAPKQPLPAWITEDASSFSDMPFGASNPNANFARVQNDIVYRHHNVTGQPKHVGTETKTGHVVHADSGQVHLSDGQATYSVSVSRGRVGTATKRDPAADKKLVESARPGPLVVPRSGQQKGTTQSLKQRFAEGEKAFRAAHPKKRAKV